MRITAIEPTDLFAGSRSHPRQLVRVTVTADDPVPAQVRVALHGPAVRTPEPAVIPRLAAGQTAVAEVGVHLDEPVTEGAVRRVTAVAETVGGPDARCSADGEIVAAVTGWTMWMVSHFHYDPVWWNTQSGFTENWYDLPAAEQRRPPVVKTAFDLVHLHLDAARHDDDYKFVLAEVDYLKPYWDAFPEDRADLRRFIQDDRVEIVGGNYNEPNTNLTHPESTIRNAVYGIGYQRDVVGGDPASAWMLDVFGHDPAYPGLMADAGLTSSAWARGPFHMWGPRRHVGDNARMQFPAEFEWISPTGRGLLTAYMANHYSAGWVMEEQARTLEEAAEAAYEQFTQLRPVAATRNVMLPVGGDHVVPSRWSTEVHRDWAKRYVWPRFAVGLPKEFFAAVRAELGATRRRPVPQTRDMNPVYTGKDVSYIDTKQAQRAAEVAVLDAERLATLAALTGAAYPAEAIDRAWRQLAYGAHHDAITGSESDQVYVDLLGGWREAYELGDTVRAAALDHLAARSDTSGPGRPIVVANTLSWRRDGLTTVHLTFDPPGPAGLTLVDDAETFVPALAEGVRTAPDGGIEEITLTFLARDVPPLGFRVYHLVEAGDPPAGWTSIAGSDAADGAPASSTTGAAAPRDGASTTAPTGPAEPADTAPRSAATSTTTPGSSAPATAPTGPAEPGGAPGGAATGAAVSGPVQVGNGVFAVTADPARGGALTSIRDLRTGRELLRDGGLGGELVCQEEYPTHPTWGEGPWHLLPKGPGKGTGERPASVRVEECAVGRRLVIDTTLDDLTITGEVLLWDGVDRVDFRTHVGGSIGQDRLLRVRFDLDVPGARPVSEVGFAAIGRPFGFPDADSGADLWTLDNPAHTWTGLSATARIALTGDDGSRHEHAIGVAELIAPDQGDPAPDEPNVLDQRPPAHTVPVPRDQSDSAHAVSVAPDQNDPAHAAQAGPGPGDPVRAVLAALAAQGVTATCSRPEGPRYGALDVDSNLPDVRISLGGPDENAFTAAVLAAAEPAYAEVLAEHGRVFVPAIAPMAGVWKPGADLRGARDLPVLIVAGDPDDLVADLADAVIDVPRPGDLPGAEEPYAGHSVALLNAGMPGNVAAYGGALCLNLMRSCSTWPSGVWIDGPMRTAPDGSSLSWQHWTHTFCYALAAGDGDWRDAGFVRAGQEYNHTVVSRPAEAHPGIPVPPDGLVTVEPSNVALAALKPAGNPLAAARPGAADPMDGVTVRLYETSGRPASARVSLFTGVADTHVTDLLETSEIRRVDGTVDLSPADVVTLRLRPSGTAASGTTHPSGTAGATDPAGAIGSPGTAAVSGTALGDGRGASVAAADGACADGGGSPGAGGAPAPLSPAAGSAQPVFTRYWLHNKGPAPLGNLPTAVHLSPPKLTGDGEVRLTVATSGRPAAGRVELDVPDALSVTGPSLDYDLAPGEHAAFALPVDTSSAAPGTYFVTARIRDDLGQALEDAVRVQVGEAPAAEPLAVVLTAVPALRPGDAAELAVELTSTAASAIRGEAQLVSPIGTWGPHSPVLAEPWTQGFSVEPGERIRVPFTVRASRTARPGSWWALVKIAYFGTLHYTETIPIDITA